jgi:hypothetical protein
LKAVLFRKSGGLRYYQRQPAGIIPHRDFFPW